MATNVDLAGDLLYVDSVVVGATSPLSLSTTPGTGNFQFTGFLRESSATGITAGTTRTQAGATALTKEINRVDTSTAPSAGSMLGDGVLLPATVSGAALDIIVINNTANPIQVYGTGADTINAQTNTVGVIQQPNSVALYCAAGTGSWFTIDIAIGFSGNYQTTSALNGITAHAGGGQGSATALPAMINRVTTVATAADSVVLPTSAPGMNIYVTNAAAANSMNVFPASGDAINALAVNTAFAVAANKSAQFICAVAGTWHAILTA